MSERAMAIVVGHGSIASGMISAVEKITGQGAHLHPISNDDLSGADLAAALQKAMEETGARIVFTDLPAGSCNMAALRVIHDTPGAVIVMGANLPALLFFAMHPELPPEEAAVESAKRGGAALKIYPDAARAG